MKRTRPLNADATTLFDKNTFDVDRFVISKEYKFSTEKAAFGEIFYYQRLSKINDRNCETCHNP